MVDSLPAVRPLGHEGRALGMVEDRLTRDGAAPAVEGGLADALGY